MNLKDIKSKQTFVAGFEAKANIWNDEHKKLLKRVVDYGAIIECQKSGQLENDVMFDVIKVYYTKDMVEGKLFDGDGVSLKSNQP